MDKIEKAKLQYEYMQTLPNTLCVYCDKEIEFKQCDLNFWIKSNKKYKRKYCNRKCVNDATKEKFKKLKELV